jgi:hypothetical protein
MRIVTTKVRGRVGSVDHQFAAPRRRDISTAFYCSSTGLKNLMEYLEVEA